MEINPNDPNYILLNKHLINLNLLRMLITELQRNGFKTIPLGDLLWHIKSAELKEKVDT
jgi:hypothetical protein